MSEQSVVMMMFEQTAYAVHQAEQQSAELSNEECAESGGYVNIQSAVADAVLRFRQLWFLADEPSTKQTLIDRLGCLLVNTLGKISHLPNNANTVEAETEAAEKFCATLLEYADGSQLNEDIIKAAQAFSDSVVEAAAKARVADVSSSFYQASMKTAARLVSGIPARLDNHRKGIKPPKM